jgi:hypothetical protein
VFRGGLCGFSAAGGQIEDLLVGARFGDLDVQFRLVRLDYQRHALRSPEFFVEAALGNFQVLLKPGFPPAPSKEPGIVTKMWMPRRLCRHLLGEVHQSGLSISDSRLAIVHPNAFIGLSQFFHPGRFQ